MSGTQPDRLTCLYVLPKRTYFSEGPCGRVTHALGVIEGLTNNGVDVTVVSGTSLTAVCGAQGLDRVTPYTVEGRPHGTLPRLISDALWLLRLAFCTLTLYRRLRPRLVIVRYSPSSVPFLMPLILCARTTLWEVNSLLRHIVRFPRVCRLLLNRLESYALRSSDFISVVSEALANDLRELNVPPAKLVVVPNAASASLTKFARAPGSDNQDYAPWLASPAFVYFGTLHNYYDFGSTISGFREFLESWPVQTPKPRLVILGDGPQRRHISSLLAEADSLPVYLAGPYKLEDLAPLLTPERHIAVLPVHTLPHGSPIKLFEFMALGLPIVAPNIPQYRPALTSGTNALLYGSHGDTLSRCMRQLFESRALRKSLGSAAREAVLAQHTWDQRMQYLLRNVLPRGLAR